MTIFTSKRERNRKDLILLVRKFLCDMHWSQISFCNLNTHKVGICLTIWCKGDAILQLVNVGVLSIIKTINGYLFFKYGSVNMKKMEKWESYRNLDSLSYSLMNFKTSEMSV